MRANQRNPARRRSPAALCRLLAAGWLLAGLAGAAWAQAPDSAVSPPADPFDSLAAVSARTGATVAIDTAEVAHVAEHLALESRAATPETLATRPSVAIPVYLGGGRIFSVRAGRDGLSISERTRAIRTRIQKAVSDDRTSPDSVRLLRTPDGIEVRLGRHFLWMITAADLGDRSAEEVSDWIAELPARIRDAIQKERDARQPFRIVISAAIAAVLTLLAWILARLLLTGSTRWSAFLRRALPRYVRGVRIRSFEVLSQAQIVGMVGGILSRLDVVLSALLLYGYLTLVFSLFPWTQGWSWHLVRFAVDLVSDGLRGFLSAVPGLLVIVVIAVVFSWIIRLAERFFDEIDAGRLPLPGFHRELARPSKRLIRILLWIIAVMIAYPYIPGSQTKAVQGVSILLGVMVSLGSTGFVGNVISGIVLTYSRSFRVGDRIRIGDVTGDVVSLGFFATKLRSIRNEEVTLPNGQVASQAIVNYTRLAEDPGLVLHTEVTIGYDLDWRRVHALLIEAARKVEGIEREPAPRVFQRSLNDHHVTYELTAVTHDSHAQQRLYSDLHQGIQDAFAAAGVEILSPAYHALRDAHAAVLPREPRGPRPDPGAFRVETK